MTGLNSQFYLFGGLGKNSHHGGRDARGVGPPRSTPRFRPPSGAPDCVVRRWVALAVGPSKRTFPKTMNDPVFVGGLYAKPCLKLG